MTRLNARLSPDLQKPDLGPVFRLISVLQSYCRAGIGISAANEGEKGPDPQPLPANRPEMTFNALAAANELGVSDPNELFVPFGEYPVRVVDPKTGRAVDCLQVLDLEAANEIAGKLNSLRGKIAGALRLLPVYIGHPDVSQFRDRYKDTRAYGWVTGANVKEGGIAFTVKWSKAGQDLVDDGLYAYYSPHWPMKPLGAANGVLRARPVGLWSIGLTNEPNIPVPAINVAGVNEMMDAGTDAEVVEQKETEKNEDSFMARIAAMLGVEPAAAFIEAKIIEMKEAVAQAIAALEAKQNADEQKWKAEEAAMTAANEQATARIATLEAQITDLAAARDQLTAANEGLKGEVTALVAVRVSAANALVEAGIADGRIPGGKREDWINAFNEDFNGAAARLQAAETMFSPSRTRGIRHRKPSTAATAGFLSAVNEAVKDGRTWEAAWQFVKRTRPELYSGMEHK